MEILNINWHTCKLLLKALNTSFNKAQASKKLGISERTIYRLSRDFGVVYDNSKSKYIAINPPSYEIIIPENERKDS